MKHFALAAALLSVCGSAFAQGTIIDGAAEFEIGTSTFDGTPEADFRGVGTGDMLFESGWWFRVDGDTSETPFPAPDTQSYVGNQSALSWSDVASRGLFSATASDIVINDGGPSGRVQRTLSVSNISGASLTLTIYNFIDMDVAGSFGSDSATEDSAPPSLHIAVADGASFADYAADNVAGYSVTAFSGTGGARGDLNDASVSTFTNTGLPFGPGDFTGAIQFLDVTLGPAESADFVQSHSSNIMFPVDLQKFEIE